MVRLFLIQISKDLIPAIAYLGAPEQIFLYNKLEDMAELQQALLIT